MKFLDEMIIQQNINIYIYISSIHARMHACENKKVTHVFLFFFGVCVGGGGSYVDFFFENPQTVAIVDEAGYTNCDASGAQMSNESGFLSYDFSNSGVVSFISAEPEGCAAGLKMQVHVE